MCSKDVLAAVIEKAVANIAASGGPFAAAILTKEGEIVSLEGNSVTRTCDPTAHAEVCAIRAACAKLGTFDLSGKLLVSSCFPCPMCFGAAYWARVDAVYYAATAKDASEVGGFDDSFIYDEIAKPDAERRITFQQVDNEDNRLKPFLEWQKAAGKMLY